MAVYVTLHGDCYELLSSLPDESIDMVLTDPPYKELSCDWDVHAKHDLPQLFNELKRIVRRRGAMVFFASMRFAAQLLQAAGDLYRYDLVWEKSCITNVPNVNHQPGRVHEHILVFSRAGASPGAKDPMWYYPVLAEGPAYYKDRRTAHNFSGWSAFKRTPTDNPGVRQPRSVIFCRREGKHYHPTQKPVALLEWLIKAYTLPGQVVLDPFMGGGSTLVAALNQGRLSVGIEKDPEFYQVACERLLHTTTGG